MRADEVLRAEMILEEFHKGDAPLSTDQKELVDRYYEHMMLVSRPAYHPVYAAFNPEEE